MRFAISMGLCVAVFGCGEETSDDSGAAEPLTLEQFQQAYVDLKCAEWGACDPETFPPDDCGFHAPTMDYCETFDPNAAQACLDGAWVCEAVGTTSTPVVSEPEACRDAITDCYTIDT